VVRLVTPLAALGLAATSCWALHAEAEVGSSSGAAAAGARSSAIVVSSSGGTRGLLLREPRTVHPDSRIPREPEVNGSHSSSASLVAYAHNSHQGLFADREKDLTDYRGDAAAFLSAHPKPSSLPSMSLAAVSRLYDALVGRLSHGLRVDFQPWLPSSLVTEGPELSPVEDARRSLADTLFDGPGLVSGVTEEWAAPRRWRASALKERLGGVRFSMAVFDYPAWLEDVPAPRETVAEYLEHFESSHGRFIFLNEPADQTNTSRRVVDVLHGDFTPLPRFAATVGEHHSVFALDGGGSSHSFHRHGPVWFTQVIGRKAWWILPPSVPGDRPHYGAAPVVNGRLYRHPNACVFLRKRRPPQGSLFVYARPGDTLLLPENFWHATCALDAYTVGLGGWLVDQRGAPHT